MRFGQSGRAAQAPGCRRWPQPGRMRLTRPLPFRDPIPGIYATLTHGPDARSLSPSGRWSHGSAPRGHRRGSGSLSCPRPAPARSRGARSPVRTAPRAPVPGRWAAQAFRPASLFTQPPLRPAPYKPQHSCGQARPAGPPPPARPLRQIREAAPPLPRAPPRRRDVTAAQ